MPVLNQKTMEEKNKIIVTICDYFNVSLGEMRSQSRKATFVLTRHFIAYFLKRMILISYREIALECGRIDHSTAHNGANNITKWIECDQELRLIHSELIEELK